MQELIKVTTTEQGAQTVSARELYDFFCIKSKFTDWIKNRIKKYGFVEKWDYVLVSKILETNNPRNPTTVEIDYTLTLDMAKELAMVEGNVKGKQARQYFIECEKQFRQLAQTQTLPVEADTLLLRQAQVLTAHAEKLNQQSQQLVNQNQRLAELERTVQQIMVGYHPPVRRHYVQSQLPHPPREMADRKQINDLVNAYCTRQGVPQLEAWSWLYDELYRRFSVNIRGYRVNANDSLLEVTERFGHMDKLYSIIMSELYYDEYR